MFRIERGRVNIRTPEDLVEENNADSPSEPEKTPQELWEEQAAQIEAEHRLKADAIISDAQKKATELVDSALIEANDIRAAAEREGFQEGTRKAHEDVERQLHEDSAMVARVLDEIAAARDRMFAEAEEGFIELVLSTVRKIVNTAIEKDDTVYESMIKKALLSMKLEGKITIRVSEEEYNRFFSGGSAVFDIGDEAISVTAIEDSDLGHLDCVLESDTEIVNAGFEAQLRAIAISFHEAGEDTQ